MRVWWSLATVLVLAVVGCTPPVADTGVDTTAPVVPSSTITTPTSPSQSTTTSTAPTTTTTTTTSATTTVPRPPRFEVLDPVHLATVTTRRYTFSGVTDPDCTVTVGGKYHATVEPDGTWALDLMLGPGRNSTTFVATDPETGLETKQAIRVYYAEGLELRPDGLGAVAFGDNETDTMAILTGLFGPPVYDATCSGSWHCSGWGYGLCRYIHTVHWPEQGLSIVIADCEGNADQPETPRLISWRAGRGDSPDASDITTLRTAEGVGPGSTLGEMQAAYGDRFVVGWDDCGGLYVAVRNPDGSGGLHGYIMQPPGFKLPDDYSGPTDSDLGLDPSTVVTGLQAGQRQSC